jgi:hypothetical protein
MNHVIFKEDQIMKILFLITYQKNRILIMIVKSVVMFCLGQQEKCFVNSVDFGIVIIVLQNKDMIQKINK